jgi:hypothetical protein
MCVSYECIFMYVYCSVFKKGIWEDMARIVKVLSHDALSKCRGYHLADPTFILFIIILIIIKYN